MEKIVVYIGDIHGNALAMTQILNYYNPLYYELVWLGDFLNSKRKDTSDKEIEYVIHMLLEHCKHILHSNHMHILYEYLSHKLFEKPRKPPQYTWKGWYQTMRVVDSLHPSLKRRLIDVFRNSHYTLENSFNGKSIIAAHSIPMISTIGEVPSLLLNEDQSLACGIKSSRSFWKQKQYMDLIENYDYIICGHHGMVSRFGKVRLCDLRGIQVPVWQSHDDTFKIFPL